MSIRDELNRLDEEMEKSLGDLENLNALEALRVHMLGKKGQLTALLRMMGQLSAEERPQIGQLINERRERFTKLLDERQKAMQKKERELRLQRERLDVTEPRPLPETGSVHPNTLVLNEVVDCFTGLGFEVVEGPEVELDHFNFELLNIPKNHPARDAQDTFYIDDNVVLRTHTSPVQARTMTTRKPPIRIICPGRVYRADEVDATHSPVFHQIEGLVIDEGVSMGDLKATLAAFARRLYGSDIQVRFRPSFFPFTEPCGPDLRQLPRQGLPHLQGHRLDRGAGLRHGQPARARNVRHRPAQVFRLRVRHRPGAHHDAALRHQGYAPDVRRRPALPAAIPRGRQGGLKE